MAKHGIEEFVEDLMEEPGKEPGEEETVETVRGQRLARRTQLVPV